MRACRHLHFQLNSRFTIAKIIISSSNFKIKFIFFCNLISFNMYSAYTVQWTNRSIPYFNLDLYHSFPNLEPDYFAICPDLSIGFTQGNLDVLIFPFFKQYFKFCHNQHKWKSFDSQWNILHIDYIFFCVFFGFLNYPACTRNSII